MSGVDDISALQLLVPAADPLTDAVRSLPHVGLLLPPHVSLGYPWRSAASALSSRDWLGEQVAAHAPIVVTLRGPEVYAADPRGRRLVHAVPEPVEEITALAASLGVRAITPHLSLARVGARGDVAATVDLLSSVLPVRTVLYDVQLSVRVGGDWTVAATFRLGEPAGPT